MMPATVSFLGMGTLVALDVVEHAQGVNIHLCRQRSDEAVGDTGATNKLWSSRSSNLP